VPLLLRRDEVVDDRSPAVGAGRVEGEAGDDTGRFAGERDLVDVVGPSDVAGLRGEVELVADVRTRRAAVGGGTVSGSSVAVDRVDVAAVAAATEYLRPDPPIGVILTD